MQLGWAGLIIVNIVSEVGVEDTVLGEDLPEQKFSMCLVNKET